jgi:hypothetical protein
VGEAVDVEALPQGERDYSFQRRVELPVPKTSRRQLQASRQTADASVHRQDGPVEGAHEDALGGLHADPRQRGEVGLRLLRHHSLEGSQGDLAEILGEVFGVRLSP